MTNAQQPEAQPCARPTRIVPGPCRWLGGLAELGCFCRPCLFPLLGFWASVAFAQGGPPLVTDDPGTPGNGRWEINFAAIRSRTDAGTEWTTPDADINYGWGDRIQLKIDTAWIVAHPTDDRTITGLGASDLGVKWRFVGSGEEGLSISTYPQLTVNFSANSSRRGVTIPGRDFFLPVEVAWGLGHFGLDAEAGWNFAQYGSDSWAAGIVVSHDCLGVLECLFEVRQTLGPEDNGTLLNLGVRMRVQESISLLGAIGEEFGAPNDNRVRALLYFGVQLRF